MVSTQVISTRNLLAWIHTEYRPLRARPLFSELPVGHPTLPLTCATGRVKWHCQSAVNGHHDRRRSLLDRDVGVGGALPAGHGLPLAGAGTGTVLRRRRRWSRRGTVTLVFTAVVLVPHGVALHHATQ